MKEVQQEVMCALLQTLVEKSLISRDIHDKARNKILDKMDWPDFFRHCDSDRKEEGNGGT